MAEKQHSRKRQVVKKANPFDPDEVKNMTPAEQMNAFICFWTERTNDLLRDKGELDEEQKAHLGEVMPKLKDERLKEIISHLLGWGDDERAELESFVAIALEMMKRSTLSKIREANRVVELRYLSKHYELNQPPPGYMRQVAESNRAIDLLYPTPTAEDLSSPAFKALREAMKNWSICRNNTYDTHSPVTDNDVAYLFKAVTAASAAPVNACEQSKKEDSL